ncbi:MAG: T9SS type A sorting domain-containing protein [Hymenobacteraceae bacterium]|nr:T9SS type A sorting domain-containing protein [Hymenobacteraceae bacterium]
MAAAQRTAYCPGDTATIAFDTIGVFAAAERDFRVEVSNEMGRFRPRQTTPLAVVSAATASPLRAVLPANLPADTRYRLRVIRADSSVLSSDNERDITIYARPGAVAVAPADSARFCVGDSVQLTAPTGFGQYQWRAGTGATPFASTAAVWVKAAGTYAVAVATAGNCFGPASAPVMVRAVPQPAAPMLTISQTGTGPALLTAAPALAGATYVWTGPAGVVAGASGPTLLLAGAAQNGSYTAIVTVRGCASPASVPRAVIITGLAAETAPPALTLHPNPARETLIVTLTGAGALRSAVLNDPVGRTVRIAYPAADADLTLDVRTLPAGLYLLRVTLADGRTSVRRVAVDH